MRTESNAEQRTNKACLICNSCARLIGADPPREYCAIADQHWDAYHSGNPYIFTFAFERRTNTVPVRRVIVCLFIYLSLFVLAFKWNTHTHTPQYTCIGSSRFLPFNSILPDFRFHIDANLHRHMGWRRGKGRNRNRERLSRTFIGIGCVHFYISTSVSRKLMYLVEQTVGDPKIQNLT